MKHQHRQTKQILSLQVQLRQHVCSSTGQNSSLLFWYSQKPLKCPDRSKTSKKQVQPVQNWYRASTKPVQTFLGKTWLAQIDLHSQQNLQTNDCKLKKGTAKLPHDFQANRTTIFYHLLMMSWVEFSGLNSFQRLMPFSAVKRNKVAHCCRFRKSMMTKKQMNFWILPLQRSACQN